LPAILMTATALVFTGCTFSNSIGSTACGITVEELCCEYRFNPLGIDVVEPRLSWVLESRERGQMQGSYQILVASSKNLLDLDEGNLWDSGKVTSDQSNQVVYKGVPLESRMRCYWKVCVWDEAGKVSTWSEPAFWTMGLLGAGDRQAKWIGYDRPASSWEEERYNRSVEECKWVWSTEGGSGKRVPPGTSFFRRTIRIDPGKEIKQARFVLVVDNKAKLFVNGQESGRASGWKITTVLNVTDKLNAGTNTLAIAVTNTGDSESPAGLAGKLVIEYRRGGTVTILIDRFWKASNTKQDDWQGSDFDDVGWSDAKEIAKVGDQPWRMPEYGGLNLPALPYMRKVFSVDRPVKKAMVYASALGLYELHINGKRIGEDCFTPGWTEYNRRVYYQSYEVTNLIAAGSNAIGAVLADGWYCGYLGSRLRRNHYGGSKPRLFVQLEIEYADGSKETVVTDSTWRAAYGPHLEADFYMGETYDARKEIPGWDTAGFDASKWAQVVVADTIQSQVQSYPGVAVKKMMEIKPKKVTEPKEDTYIFDMGQNFAGWARLKVKGEAGTKVVMRFAEVLNPDGTIYTTNLCSARCTDTYILSGKDEEIWEPRFTFHGFRYVEVTGYPGKPELDDITGVVVHSDAQLVGSFECSNPMVNQLYSNLVWSQRSNYIEVPTDCPQRDERLGWTGDAQIFIRTATYNMDVAAFYTKWLIDLEDAQSKEGAFPDLAPRKITTGGGKAGWGDAGVICPWMIYQVYGDKRIIERHYDSMKKWIAYLQRNSKNLLRPAKGYGDWVSIGSDTPKDVIATAYFAYSTRLLSEMAAAIGRNEDAKKYEELFERIRDAFNKAYVSDDGRIKGNTQTCYCLGLYFDLLPEDKRELAGRHLVEAIRGKKWHLSTGFIGLSYLLPTLTQTGHLDVAYRLLENDTFPSWGYSIKNGATTIWERWDGWTEEKGFQDPGMNSFNHYAFGSVGEWLFGTVAGIDTDGPGYKRIIIRPRHGSLGEALDRNKPTFEGMTAARASYKSVHGRIVSDWKIEDSTFMLNVTIPVNTTATVYVPAKGAGSVTESGRPVEVNKTDPRTDRGVQFLRMEDDVAVFAIGSGDYRFVSTIP